MVVGCIRLGFVRLLSRIMLQHHALCNDSFVVLMEGTTHFVLTLVLTSLHTATGAAARSCKSTTSAAARAACCAGSRAAVARQPLAAPSRPQRGAVHALGMMTTPT